MRVDDMRNGTAMGTAMTVLSWINRSPLSRPRRSSPNRQHPRQCSGCRRHPRQSSTSRQRPTIPGSVRGASVPVACSAGRYAGDRGKAGKGRAIVGYDPNRAPLGAHAIEISVYMSRMADAKLALAEAEAARSEAVKRRATQLEAQEAAREAERKAKTDHFIDAGLNTLRLLFGAV